MGVDIQTLSLLPSFKGNFGFYETFVNLDFISKCAFLKKKIFLTSLFFVTSKWLLLVPLVLRHIGSFTIKTNLMSDINFGKKILDFFFYLEIFFIF